MEIRTVESSLFMYLRGMSMYVTCLLKKILEIYAKMKPTHESKNEGGVYASKGKNS